MNPTLSIYFNLLKGVVGSGILFSPVYFKKYGIVPTALMFSIGGTMAIVGLIQFLIVNKEKGPGSMNSIFKNQIVNYLISLVVISKTILVVSTYYKTVNQIFSNLLPNFKSAIYIYMGCIFPLTCFKKIDFLRFSSFIGFLSVCYLVALSAFNYLTYTGSLNPIKLYTNENIIFNIPFFIFSFTCHQIIFTVHNEFYTMDIAKIKKIIIAVIFTCFMIYTLFGYLNYRILDFTDYSLNKSYLKFIGFSTKEYIAYVSYLFVISFSIPLQLVPCRKYLHVLIFKKEEMEFLYVFILSVLIKLTCLLIYISPFDISALQKIVGSTSSNLLCFILPAFFVLYGIKRKKAIHMIAIFLSMSFGLLVFSLFLYEKF